MTKRDAWPTPDPEEAKRAREMFKKDLREVEQEDEEVYTRGQMSEDYRRAYEERLAEILMRPQHILVENAELDRLMSGEEVSLQVCLRDRQLLPGEKVILDDENMTEHEAEFVEVEQTINKNDGVFLVKVRLPKSQ